MWKKKSGQPGESGADDSGQDDVAGAVSDEFEDFEPDDVELDEPEIHESELAETEGVEYLELDDSETTGGDEPDDGAPSSGSAKSAKSQKSRTTTPASGRPSPLRLDRATKMAVDRIDDHERRYALTAAFGGALLWMVLYVSWAFSHATTPKGKVPLSTDFYFGIGVCALLLLVTLLRRRALIGFAVLFLALTFTSTLTGFFVAIPFFAFGGWLIIRGFKIQAKVARGELSVEDAIAGKAPSGLSTGSRPKDMLAAGKAAGTPRSTSTTNKRYTNKRYTPPKPKKKPVKAEPKP